MKISKKRKLLYLTTALCFSFLLCINVGRGGSTSPQGFSFGQSNRLEDTYVLDNIDIDYQYDKENYEVESFVNQPYAVIKGNAQVINKLRMLKKKPHFYIDLNDKKPGTYKEKIKYDGLDEQNVTVTIYPIIAELKLREQQTVKYTPVIELSNTQQVDSNYVVGSPKVMEPKEIRVRDTQENLAAITQIKGIVDVSQLKETTELTVKLAAYNRDGKRMDHVHLVDTSVLVKVPVNKKVIVKKIHMTDDNDAEKVQLTEEAEKLKQSKAALSEEQALLKNDRNAHVNEKKATLQKEQELAKREADLKDKEERLRKKEAALAQKEKEQANKKDDPTTDDAHKKPEKNEKPSKPLTEEE